MATDETPLDAPNSGADAAAAHSPTRREFIAAAGAAGLALGLPSAASYARVLGANDRIRTGFIGVGNRGSSLLDHVLKSCPAAEVIAACDVYEPYLANAKSKLGPSAAGYTDYRKLLENKDIDAIVVATPDHWHALPFVDACRAGKDVYVEKPFALTVAEGRKMVKVAAETGRVAQMGAQRSSSPAIIEACKLMREGVIGKITRVRCYHLTNEYPAGLGKRVVSDPPPGLDWDMWLGPAPKIPFQEVLWNYKFRWFWDYSGGQMTNFGTHWLGVVQMALGQDAPQSVCALGGRFAVDDAREVPDTMETIWQFKDCLVTFSQINANDAPGSPNGADMEFRGTLGTLYIFNNRFEIVPNEILDGPYQARGPLNRTPNKTKKMIEPKTVQGGVDEIAHLRNFFDCVKTRAKCNCDPETGQRATTTTLIGNIALRTGALLHWDRDKERFTNNNDANRMLGYKYRAPWRLDATKRKSFIF